METQKNESKRNVNPRKGSVEKGDERFLVKKNEHKPKLTTMMGGNSAFGHPCSKLILDTNFISYLLQCKTGSGDSVKFQQLQPSRETEKHIQVIFILSRSSMLVLTIAISNLFKIFCNLQITRFELFKFLGMLCFRHLILLAT